MPTKNIEFDRTFFKTHKSRSKKFDIDKNYGFTLIELLVVISIIALLSTVILSVVNDARVKARNTAKNNLVLEYIKALEMYRGNNSSYPSAGADPLYRTKKCIGYPESGESCQDSFNGSDIINNAFSTYLPNNFAEKNPLIINIGGDRNMKGVTYKCSNDTCSSYTLEWYLEGDLTNCIDKSTSFKFPNANVPLLTYCNFSLK